MAENTEDKMERKINLTKFDLFGKKSLITIILFLIVIFFMSAFLFSNNRNDNHNNGNDDNNYTFEEFNKCLADFGMVIYGSEWCPACNALVQTLGGNDKVKSVYVDCTKEGERCQEELKTNFIPEIQINGVVYDGSRSLSALSDLTGCKIPK